MLQKITNNGPAVERARHKFEEAPFTARKKLLWAAYEEIYRRGYQGARVDRILAAVGLTKGAFYHYFPQQGRSPDIDIRPQQTVDLALSQSLFDGTLPNLENSVDPLPESFVDR